MSLMDRIILSLLVQPLRDTFQISDVQFGLLFGTSFAILYGLLGFPAARLADTKNRTRLVFCGTILWDGCTAASGFAQRSVGRRVGNVCVRVCRSRWSPFDYKKKKQNQSQNKP